MLSHMVLLALLMHLEKLMKERRVPEVRPLPLATALDMPYTKREGCGKNQILYIPRSSFSFEFRGMNTHSTAWKVETLASQGWMRQGPFSEAAFPRVRANLKTTSRSRLEVPMAPRLSKIQLTALDKAEPRLSRLILLLIH